MTLEEAIIDAAKSGRVSLTVYPISTGYQASLSGDGNSWRVEMGPDALTALKKVLGLLPGASGPMRSAPPPENLFAPEPGNPAPAATEEDVFS